MKNRSAHKSTVVRENVGYARVSTADQAQGVSLAAQEEKLRAYAFATGRPIGHVYVDEALSGKNTSRPALTSLLDEVRHGRVASIFVVKIDRLTRSIRDLCDIVELTAKHDCSLVSTAESIDTGTASGRMVLNLLGILAQFEREQISERTALSLAHLRRLRRPYGKTPFGYVRVENTLVPDPQRLDTLERIHKQRLAGASYRKIAQWLHDEGVAPNQGGSKWHPSAVRDILRGPMLEELLTSSVE